MTSANWNQETKNKLNEKITSNMNDLGSLVRHVIRTSKSNDLTCEHKGYKHHADCTLLAQAARNFASQESVIHNSEETLKKISLIQSQFEYQEAAIERSMSSIEDIQDGLKTIQR